MEGKCRRSRSYAISIAPMMGGNDTKDAWSCPIGYEKDVACSIARRSVGEERTELPFTGPIAKKSFDYMMEGGILRCCAATRWHHRSAFELATTSKPIQVARILVSCVCICDMSMPRHAEVHEQIMWPQAHIYPGFWQQQGELPSVVSYKRFNRDSKALRSDFRY